MFLDPTGFIFSGVSLLEGAPHPNIANAFLEWWYTEDIQSKVLQVGGIPVLPTVEITGDPGTPGAILREWLGAPNIYEAVKKFEAPAYNFTLALERLEEVNRIFDETIVNKHDELKAAYDVILSANQTLAKLKAKTESLKAAGADVSKAEESLAGLEASLAEALKLFDTAEYSAAKDKAWSVLKEAEKLLGELKG